ncbi:hypothetical protein [Streptomyces sp. NPDC053367]|uniref:hypothetical protein n=1 Tax=Streptomyces sp. NPDC053367 TaxID=3365700 RepID=UPI0037D0D27C
MPRITAATRTVALALTALAAVSLTACGTETTSTQRTSTDVAGARPTQTRAAASGAETAFAAMLDEVGRSCPAHGPRDVPPTDLPADDPATEELEGPIAPTAGPEAELDARDWCVMSLHEERVTRALLEVTDPAPAEVRKVLNGLGYIDARIHRLERSGTTTRFLLDLRDKGGRLCLDGTAAGERTLVEGCVAPESGPLPLTSR